MRRSSIILLAAATSLAFACQDAVPVPAATESLARVSSALGPNIANVVLGEDFTDEYGRLWTCEGKATFINVDNPDSMFVTGDQATPLSPPSPPPESLSSAELAELVRPVRLVGGYEYRLAQPDTLLAQKILAMQKPPETAARSGGTSPPAALAAGQLLQPQFIIGSDDRWLTYAGPYGRVQQNCTFAMIGPSTALCAAHCFYQNGAWISGGLLWLSVYNLGNSPGNAVFPNGVGGWYAASLTIPTAWTTGAGMNNPVQTPANHSGMDWDFAVLEFSPTRYPGYTSGWYGTKASISGTLREVGYPMDKVLWSQWGIGGSFSSQSGARYVHYMDIYGGESGSCFYDLSDTRCTGIVSSVWNNGVTLWNEARAWDSTTYNFFDTYGNWP